MMSFQKGNEWCFSGHVETDAIKCEVTALQTTKLVILGQLSLHKQFTMIQIGILQGFETYGELTFSIN